MTLQVSLRLESSPGSEDESGSRSMRSYGSGIRLAAKRPFRSIRGNNYMYTDKMELLAFTGIRLNASSVIVCMIVPETPWYI